MSKGGAKMLKVMLVDDEEWCLQELSYILQKIEGIKITGIYSNAAGVLGAAAREAPDLVFIDVQMPGMSGLDLALRLKQLLKNVSIVLISEKECFAIDGFDIGVDDYILKPFRKERILKALDKAG